MKTRLQTKKGRKSNYVKNSVNSASHKEARELILQRENGKCKICGSSNQLEMHHISYSIKGRELDGLKWLVLLCSNCHQNAHNDINHKYNPKNPFKQAIY